MSKLLKHLGLGGSNKKSGSTEFQAKTLPPAMSRVADTSCGTSGASRRDMISRTNDMSDGSNHHNDNSYSSGGRRASHESYRTMPARGLRTRSERDWSLRGTKTREMSSGKLSSCHETDSSTSSRRRSNTDSKELRRSFTADEMPSKSTVNGNPPPALGEYSDPFDLKKMELNTEPTASETVAVATSPVLPLIEDEELDYSVPYELKVRLKEAKEDVDVLPSVTEGVAFETNADKPTSLLPSTDCSPAAGSSDDLVTEPVPSAGVASSSSPHTVPSEPAATKSVTTPTEPALALCAILPVTEPALPLPGTPLSSLPASGALLPSVLPVNVPTLPVTSSIFLLPHVEAVSVSQAKIPLPVTEPLVPATNPMLPATSAPLPVTERTLQRVTNDCSSKYDDPYEENPIAVLRQCSSLRNKMDFSLPRTTAHSVADASNGTHNQADTRQNQVTAVISRTCEREASLRGTNSCSASAATSPVGAPVMAAAAVAAPVHSRSFELSAEYGGFFVAPSNSQVKDIDEDVEGYSDLQAECCLQPIPTSTTCHSTPALHSGGTVGLYDQPWDLSTFQRGFEEQVLRAKKSRDVGVMAVMDGAAASEPAATALYAQPRRCEDRQQRHVAPAQPTDPRRGVDSRSGPSMRAGTEPRFDPRVVADPRVGTGGGGGGTGPSYGVLCEKPAENGAQLVPPPLYKREAGTGSCSRKTTTSTGCGTDSRPGDEYDVPWDHRKQFICKTASDAGSHVGRMSTSTAPPSVLHSRSYSSFTERDLKQPLETQIWYHGSISRRDAENLLRIQREGSYVVRTSESNKQDYSLSVRSVSGFMHMKIVANRDGRYILGQFSQPFQSIAQIIQYYTVNKLPIKGAEHISLTIPVARELL